MKGNSNEIQLAIWGTTTVYASLPRSKASSARDFIQNNSDEESYTNKSEHNFSQKKHKKAWKGSFYNHISPNELGYGGCGGRAMHTGKIPPHNKPQIL